MAISQIGHLCLFLFVAIAIFSFIAGIFIYKHKYTETHAFLKNASFLQFLLISLAFICLLYGFGTSDFSLKLVYEHSHSNKPFMYKLTALWANHEGSLLLWIWILALYQSFIARQNAQQVEFSLIFLNLLSAGLGTLILFSSNPFNYISPVPENGLGLNPLLQDPGLAYHPPFLYLGYVGYGAVAALVCGAMICNFYDQIWLNLLKKVSYFAFMFLTIGITMGSFWAYYELGWGGFWFWDPVENVALIPWLFGIILIHMIKLYEVRKISLNWIILSAIFAFIFSLIGTFIVRSGILISIHSFVTDPNRGIIILGLISFFSLFTISIYMICFKLNQPTIKEHFLSKTHFMILNGLIITIIALIVIFGTLYPIIHEAFYQDIISVGGAYFNKILTPIVFILLLLMGALNGLNWNGLNKKRFLNIIVLAVFLFFFLLKLELSLFSFLGILLSLWVTIGIILEFLLNRPKIISALPYLLGHIGFAIFILAISFSTQYSTSITVKAMAGEKFKFEQYNVILKKVHQFQKANYITTQAIIEMRKDGEKTVTLKPERRLYQPSNMNITETSISLSPFKNIYAVLLPVDQNGVDTQWLLTLHLQYFMIWIWIGGLMIASAVAIALLNHFILVRKK